MRRTAGIPEEGTDMNRSVTSAPSTRETGTGFSFTNYNAHEMMNTINYAKHVFYNNKREWNKIVDRGMLKDFSWASSAKKYQKLYDNLLGY